MRYRLRSLRSAGFSLLEVLVALLISLTALMLASQLLVESQSRMAHTARQAMDPVGEIVGQQLRADLRAAAGVHSPGFSGWSRDPLVISGHPTGILRYEKVERDLFREVSDGSPANRRLVLSSVTTFRWRRRGNSVEIDLRYRVTPGWERLVAGGVREEPLPREEKLLLRVTPRGNGGLQW